MLEVLANSKPAYMACLWPQHDATNRRRAAEQKTFVDRYGEDMAQGVASIYRTEWPEAVIVDLMKYSDNRGANTISGAKMQAPPT